MTHVTRLDIHVQRLDCFPSFVQVTNSGGYFTGEVVEDLEEVEIDYTSGALVSYHTSLS